MSNQVWIWVVTALKVSLRDWLSGLAWQGGGGRGDGTCHFRDG